MDLGVKPTVDGGGGGAEQVKVGEVSFMIVIEICSVGRGR